MNDEYGINTRLSLKTVKRGTGPEFKLLALDGEIIPGQTAIWEVEPTDRSGITRIGVFFELYGDMGE